MDIRKFLSFLILYPSKTINLDIIFVQQNIYGQMLESEVFYSDFLCFIVQQW